MNQQLEISFVHAHENNHDSKRHLEENRTHFSNQCLLLLEIFNRGERLTTRDALIKYNIGDLRRRVCDLKENNIDIKTDWKLDEEGNKTRFKVYYK